MNINEVRDLMREFDGSSLREFSWNNGTDALSFSKNNVVMSAPIAVPNPIVEVSSVGHTLSSVETKIESNSSPVEAEGEILKSPLVGVIYLKSAPEKPDFVKVGDSVKKGQTLLIIEAMKVMNEILSPKDGIITEILVSTDEVVEFGQSLVRIK
ncbi:acetyl-CoA carboxylase biotin carboxyl carrier protein [Lactovum miscens]|uniref:Biotin carboxyl carrier protein of acetyl-CoA carboxylase n=1 Tax=Lactovum miscens TaxID=190387 RepID=A0A841C443_9LACT|nr:acetyl-CoA carboxylase biotin carboxyl carrier protein [Lactovum miscens]MBB5887175.1 acetyl-CoA carboxylase biotin carboxyl carrier protein [Lactovum miscens]